MDTVNSTTANEGADDICAQYAAIGCIEGRCVVLMDQVLSTHSHVLCQPRTI